MLGVFDQVHKKNRCIVFHVNQLLPFSNRQSKSCKILELKLKMSFFFYQATKSLFFFARVEGFFATDFAPSWMLIYKMMHRFLVIKVLRDYKKDHDYGIDTPTPNDYME